MEVRHRTFDEQQLQQYYSAALQFIDEQLGANAALADVETAAARRRQALNSLPEQVARADREQLNEALEFVRRAYCRFHPQRCDEDEIASALDAFPGLDADEAEFEAVVNGNGHAELHEQAVQAPVEQVTTPVFADAELQLDETAVEAPPAEQRPAMFASRIADTESAAAEPHSRSAGAQIASRTDRRRSPLSRIWEEQVVEPCVECLPEQQVLPIAGGLLLLAYEAWLALFAGWVVTRYIAWPREGLGYELTTLGALGVVFLGVAGATVTAHLIWRYRTSTGRLAALVHAGGALIGLDLLAWKIAATDTLPVIASPGAIAVVLLVLGWAGLATAAHIADLRRS